MGTDRVPEAGSHFWFLLPVHEPCGQSGLARQERCILQGLFSRLIVQVGINHLKESRRAFRAWFREIQKDHWLATSSINRGSDPRIVLWITGQQYRQECIG